MQRLPLVALVAACSSSAPPPAPAPAAAASPRQEKPVITDESRARAFLAMLAKHDFGGAFATFDERMRGAMPEAQLTAFWEKLEQQAGSLERIDGVTMVSA